MSMTAWNPITEIDAMRTQLDRLFNQMWGGPMATLARPEAGRITMLLPPIELYTSDDKQLVLKVELPGLAPEQVAVEIAEDAVHLTGEMKREEKISDENYYRCERQYGQFERVVPLPLKIKVDQAKATFKNGVLTIKAPLAEALKRPSARKLTIEKQ